MSARTITNCVLLLGLAPFLSSGSLDTAPTSRSTYCRTASDTAARVEGVLLSALATVDPGDLDEYGFLSMPDSLSLVTSDRTCAILVAAYNAHITMIDSTQTISSTYLFTDGTGYIFPVYLGMATHFVAAQTADSTFTIRRGFEFQ